MRLIIYSTSCVGRGHDAHLHDAYARNGYHANVSDNTSTYDCASCRDGLHDVAGKDQQTDHSDIHYAASAHSYNHIGYNHVTYRIAHSSHSYDCYSIRVHDHVHDRGWVEVVSNQNEYSNQCSLP